MERRREFKLVRRTLPSAVAQTVERLGLDELADLRAAQRKRCAYSAL